MYFASVLLLCNNAKLSKALWAVPGDFDFETVPLDFTNFSLQPLFFLLPQWASRHFLLSCSEQNRQKKIEFLLLS